MRGERCFIVQQQSLVIRNDALSQPEVTCSDEDWSRDGGMERKKELKVAWSRSLSYKNWTAHAGVTNEKRYVGATFIYVNDLQILKSKAKGGAMT